MNAINITNESFHDLPVKLRTVLIAYDILYLVNTDHRFHPSAGIYGAIHFKESVSNFENQIDLKSSFDKIEDCTMCAKGFALLSKVRLNGACLLNGVANDYVRLSLDRHITPNLVPGYMESETYEMIECLFEGSSRYHEDDVYGDYTIDTSVDQFNFHVFNKNFLEEEHEFRLSEIFRNLVFNNGIINLENHPGLSVSFRWDTYNKRVIWEGDETLSLY